MADKAQAVQLFMAQRILAMDGTEPEAFAVQDGRIIAAGSRRELSTRFPGGDRIDLDGSLVVPGFNDAHCHVSQAALARVRVDLTAVTGTAELRRLIADRAAVASEDDWVLGQAFDERHPGLGTVDRHFLDAVSATRAIVLVHYSFHKAVANTRALELLGYRTPDDAPFGGGLMTDDSGQLNGWLIERAWLDPWLPGHGGTSVAVPGETGAQIAALRSVNDEMHALGITSYCDAIVTGVEQEMYAAALAEDALTARVSMLQWYTSFDERTDPAAFGSPERLRMAGVKMMLDGALSGGTCLCRHPYQSATGTGNGLQILSDEEFGDIVRRVHDAGQRAAVHANGDHAVAKVLEVFEALPDRGGQRLNHRIEHCSMVDRSLIARIKAAGVTPVLFGAFIYFHGQEIEAFYGAERSRMICAHKSLLEAGVEVAGSSDYPLVPADPLRAVQSMVTRRSSDGLVLGPEQRLSVTEALAVYTSGSARATGESGLKGRLAVGQLADFVALDRDPTALDPSDIAEAGIRSTWVGGDCVWARS